MIVTDAAAKPIIASIPSSLCASPSAAVEAPKIVTQGFSTRPARRRHGPEGGGNRGWHVGMVFAAAADLLADAWETPRRRMSNANGVIVNFADVQKTYDGESLVIRNLNLDVFRGEFLTLLGPSGSGKTTTLMMLAGFEVPSHGVITL